LGLRTLREIFAQIQLFLEVNYVFGFAKALSLLRKSCPGLVWSYHFGVLENLSLDAELFPKYKDDFTTILPRGDFVWACGDGFVSARRKKNRPRQKWVAVPKVCSSLVGSPLAHTINCSRKRITLFLKLFAQEQEERGIRVYSINFVL